MIVSIALVVSSIKYRRFSDGIAIKNRIINGDSVHNNSTIWFSILFVLCNLFVIILNVKYKIRDIIKIIVHIE